MAIEMRFEVLLSNPFASISSQSILRALQDVQLRWAQRLQARVEQYPAQRPGQTYVRTFQFRGAWDIIPPRLLGSDLVTDLVNDTPYAIFVVGDDVGNLQNQAYHAGRWYLFRREVERSEAQLRQEAQDALNRVLAPARITP